MLQKMKICNNARKTNMDIHSEYVWRRKLEKLTAALSRLTTILHPPMPSQQTDGYTFYE